MSTLADLKTEVFFFALTRCERKSFLLPVCFVTGMSIILCIYGLISYSSTIAVLFGCLAIIGLLRVIYSLFIREVLSNTIISIKEDLFLEIEMEKKMLQAETGIEYIH